MKIPWERFGAKLGVGFAIAGFVFIFLGWNGAASTDRIQSQFPYLISGGLVGLCLVVIGAALIIAESGREDRERLRAEIAELRSALGSAGTGSSNGGAPAAARVPRGSFVAGDTTYHLPTCRLLERREGLEAVNRETITVRGLMACRVCNPSGAPARRR